MESSNFSDALMFDIKYDRGLLAYNTNGMNVGGVVGHPIFVRDVVDQQYIEAVEIELVKSWYGRLFFKFWKSIDYGRSLLRVGIFAFALAIIFGASYSILHDCGIEVLKYPDNRAITGFTPFYYSIVTFTTLGFGDVTPNNLPGEILVVIEVVLGYMNLGLLLAVLANKVARRS